MSSDRTAASAPPAWLVACLCAQWCRTCDAYEATFEAIERDFAGARFIWVDVEDQADLLDTLDVENFPTILIARLAGESAEAVFFGPLTPQPETLLRLLRVALAGELASAAVEPPVHALAKRLSATAPSGS